MDYETGKYFEKIEEELQNIYKILDEHKLLEKYKQQQKNKDNNTKQ